MFKTQKKGRGKAQPAALPASLTKAERKQVQEVIGKARRDDGTPRTAQQSIPFQRMFPDGVCRVTDSYYTKTIRFNDINYQLAQQEDKTAIFEEWCSFLNFFDSSIHFELSFMNMATDAESFERSVRIPPAGDEFDPVRAEYSQMLKNQLSRGNNGLTKAKYLTFGIEAASMRQAKPRLDHVETDLLNNFRRIGVSASVLDGKERLCLMHSMFHMGEREPFAFEWKWLVESGLSVKDFIAPAAFAFNGRRTFQVGGMYGSMSFLSITASDISDRMLADILDIDSSQIVTMHIQSIDQNKAIKTVKHTITELDRSKIEEQKKAVRAGYDIDIIPSDLATYGRDAKALLKELQSQNERMFMVTFLVMNTGRTEQELETNVFQSQSIAQKHNCVLRRLDYQQEQGLMSSLPLAQNLIEIQRGLTTSSTAIFIPFTTQELFQDRKESLYYGLNALSNNLIMVDRKSLKNPNGLILGTPGSGKSFAAKREIANAFLVSDDDVIICDPEAEYAPLVERFGGQIIKISPSSSQYVNPMDINLNYSEEDNPVALKADFILSLCELVVGGKEGLQPVEKTVIDRCVHHIYQKYFENPTPENMPLLQDLYEALLEQEEKEARHVATALEIYVTGSLNIFNHRTNVDIENRIVCFDIKDLGKQMKKIGMLVVQDQVWGRVTQNRIAGKATRYFMDEFHLLLKEEQTAAYSVEIWKRFRKWGGIPTGITQNVKDLLSSREVENIFENSDFIIMLNQAAGDRQILAKQLNISPHQLSYTLVDGEVYYRENSMMKPVELSPTAKGRVAGMIGLREIVNDLIAYQLEDFPDEDIRAKQAELSAAYDAFYAKYGTINSSANARVFDEDSYYLLCSLENIGEDGQLESKADMFTKRTIRPERHITSVDTPSEALAVSIGERGRVDLQFMSGLLGTPGEYGRITEELRGVIFRDPREAVADDPARGWHTADDYLSGDVRDKLVVARMAAAADPAYEVNVAALEQAQPKDLDASEIDVRLGATWLDKDYIQQFMVETFDTPWRMRDVVQVQYSPTTAEWQVTGKNATGRHDVTAYMTYGTDRANAYRILEDTLNLRDIRIYDQVEDADGKPKRVLNKKETTLAQQKQQAIKDAFRDWVWRDPQRRADLVRTYNDLFNSTRPREYDGSHIVFGGMNPDITLREHQRGAIAHVLYGGNTLLAHEVGAGKTFEMAASAMEAKRLGLCQKSMFVVPNHLTLQWASEFLRLYPSAKVLVATKRDFETARRKKFCARIATGDYDAVIIGHSQFEKIPLSAERQERILQEQIDEITDAISEMKAMRGESFTIKQMEKTRRTLEARMEKLQAAERKDDVITFEQLGVDRLFVDEAHAFKNLFLHTKMRNVAGLSTSEAQKSSDMFMKCQYMDELTGGRGVIFATGTPVSNSMTELYTMMRYLQHSTLQQKGLAHFDQWASTFGETTTAIELAPEGTGYRARTRFAKFFNLPELMGMFKAVADIKTADQLHLPVPEAKFETVVVQPSDIQKEMVADLSERAAAVHNGNVDPSVDNMLKITSDGRKIGLDQRLINPLLPDDPNSKLNACVQNVLRIWEDGKEDRLTQLLFCDLSTPKGDGTFNVYEDIRDKLVAAGVPAGEIAFIHDADTEAKKKELFSKVRTGEVRVLLGSTQKMGAGTNVQDRLVAVHHLDVGWRPADMTQRNGRIIRQGNQNKQVQVFQYVTEGTFDAYLYQTLENKQKFISQIMTSKSPVRSCDDVDEQALSYAEIKALCAGNPLIKEKMDLDIDVAKLKVLRADYQSKHFRLEDQLLKYFPAEIEAQQSRNRGFEADIQTVAAHPLPEEGFVGMEVGGRHYAEKAEAGDAILALCKETKSTEGIPIGSYRGFAMELSFDTFSKEFQLTLKGEMSHRVSLGADARGNLTRLDNALAGIPGRLEKGVAQLENLQNQQAAAREELKKPFPQEAELAEKSARLAELDAALSMDDSTEQEEREEASEGERPSVLADLKKRAAEIEPDKKPGKEPER